MSQYWESLASRSNGENTADEFESTAYRLTTEQVIYHADRHGRVAYSLIDRYEREFRQALTPLGIEVQVNRQLRYAYALPRHSKSGSASVAQTLLALVLRQIYDESARIGQLNDDGEVVCDLVELEEKYRLATGRELPGKGDLDDLLRTLKRWGIARKGEDPISDEGEYGAQPYVVVIRPAIADVLGETALARLSGPDRILKNPRKGPKTKKSENRHEISSERQARPILPVRKAGPSAERDHRHLRTERQRQELVPRCGADRYDGWEHPLGRAQCSGR